MPAGGRPADRVGQQLERRRRRGASLAIARVRSVETARGRWSRSRQRCWSMPWATAWNVPAVTRPATPSRGRRRRSSPAASRVKVSTSVCCSSAVPFATR